MPTNQYENLTNLLATHRERQAVLVLLLAARHTEQNALESKTERLHEAWMTEVMNLERREELRKDLNSARKTLAARPSPEKQAEHKAKIAEAKELTELAFRLRDEEELVRWSFIHSHLLNTFTDYDIVADTIVLFEAEYAEARKCGSKGRVEHAQVAFEKACTELMRVTASVEAHTQEFNALRRAVEDVKNEIRERLEVLKHLCHPKAQPHTAALGS